MFRERKLSELGQQV
uniref:Uncharacterized protein n=1 Tax=Rhizophora mucronata TaxID=61149 RepID=A0A2P2PDQ1_RHIMU